MAENSNGVVATEMMITGAVRTGDLERFHEWARQGSHLRLLFARVISF
jgi:hypothetical protein